MLVLYDTILYCCGRLPSISDLFHIATLIATLSVSRRSVSMARSTRANGAKNGLQQSSDVNSSSDAAVSSTAVHHGNLDHVCGITDTMVEEEKRMENEALGEERERDLKLEKEREQDTKQGEEVLDTKFKRLQYLLGQSEVRTLGSDLQFIV